MEEVQKKIKGIRVQYTRERQKTRKRKSGDGADDMYTSKWVHFHRLRFLDDFITAKQSVSNYRKVQYIHSYNVVGLFHSNTNKHYTYMRTVWVLLDHVPLPCNTSLLGYEILT